MTQTWVIVALLVVSVALALLPIVLSRLLDENRGGQ